MDDCSLEKLAIKPGKLTPKYHGDTLEYSTTLGSNVDKINIDCLTSDTGASYCISGSGGSRTVELKEGVVNEIKIEVTAEDGTTRNYIIQAKRLSAKDAVLSGLKVSAGSLHPEFCGDVFSYTCEVACDTPSVSVTPSVPDTKAAVTVNGAKAAEPITLNVGDTLVEVGVTSPDGSSQQTYEVAIQRKPLPVFIQLTDASLAPKVECPVTLSPLYCPVSIQGTEPRHQFSGPVIDELTKTSKVDPLSDLPLGEKWRVADYELDKKLTEATGTVPLMGGGVIEATRVGDLGTKLKEQASQVQLKAFEKTFDTNVPVNHTYTCRPWEKELVQIFDETNSGKLAAAAQEKLKKYFETLPQPGWNCKFEEGQSPLDYLHEAAVCLASGIKVKKNDAALHLQLGLILEEKYYAEDIVGLKKTDHSEIAGFNLEARESSKTEECAAICELRGVSASAPLSLQLKAIDQEYHHLLQSGQGGKADHVMGLFQWKSKQATQEGAAAQKVSDEESSLGQAYFKYLDALATEESKASHHYHVGRMLVVRGDYEEAVPRLEAALGWNAGLPMARFYLGYALSLQKEGPGPRAEEAIAHLRESIECLLAKNVKDAMVDGDKREKREWLHAEQLMTNQNVHLLRGMIQLAKLLQKDASIKDCMAPHHLWHTACVSACAVLPQISRGDLYQQVEWVLLEAHSLLLDHLMAASPPNTPLIVQRCQRLSALIKRVTIPDGPEVMALQQRTCQRLVELTPCSSVALVMLGGVQLAKHDSDPEAEGSPAILKDAVSSFRASIALEGKPAVGAIPQEIIDQGWWQAKLKAAETKNPAAAPKGGAAGARGGAKGPAVRGGAARGGAVAGRGGAAARGRGAAAGPAKPAGRGAPATRGRGAPAGRGAAASAAAKPAPAPAAPSQTKAEPAPAAVPSDAPINKKTHHARLGLARALTRTEESKEEALKFYKEVMDIAPQVHDAYIESGEMMAKTDPLAAVDIYCKFPVSEMPNFDDAYIFGEVVRHLMKAERYDDERLEKNLIGMGRVLGIGTIETYTRVLDDKFKTELLKKVYAGVNYKTVDDSDMIAFFKYKCWV